MDLTDESIARLVEGLLRTVEEGDMPLIMRLLLDRNAISDTGLGYLARVLGKVKTLEVLDIGDNPRITTLAPLAAAGVFEELTLFNAHRCSFSGEVFSEELCANLPGLKQLDVYENRGNMVTFKAEELCALPAECEIYMCHTRVKVARGSSEDLVTLPTNENEEFDNWPGGRTVADICAFAGVQRVPMVKPASATHMYCRE